MDRWIWCFIKKNKTVLSLLLALSLLCPNPKILADVSAEPASVNAEDEESIVYSKRETNEASAIFDGTPIEIVRQLEDDELSMFVGHNEALAVMAQGKNTRKKDLMEDDTKEPEEVPLPSDTPDEEENTEEAEIKDPASDTGEESVMEEVAEAEKNTDESMGGVIEDIGMLEGDAATLAGDGDEGGDEDCPEGSADAIGLHIHYVSENDQYYVIKNSDFNLKYQIDFTADTSYKPQEMKIRIPAMLFEDRGGNPIKPADIGVSKGFPEKPVKSKTSVFNYYYETIDGVEYITFFNYDLLNQSDIVSIQVLYKAIDTMSTVDGSAWDLPATVSVYEDTENESVCTTENHVGGRVDTNSTVDYVRKTPEEKMGSHYPEVYTPNQVKDVLGSLPDIISGDNFKNYKYIVWMVEASGTGNQPADIILDDYSYTYVNGDLVEGIVLNSDFQKIGDQYEKTLQSNNQRREWRYGKQTSNAIKIVVAYPVDKLDSVKVYNKATIRVVPTDSPQKENEMTDEAECVYHDYNWQYSGDEYSLGKIGGQKERVGGLNAYKVSSERGEDFVSVPFTASANMQEYRATHYTEPDGDHERGEYIPGTSYTLVLQDAATYAADRNNTDPETYTLLGYDDYYFNSVVIKSQKMGYDVYEDTKSAPSYQEDDTGLMIYAMYGDSPGQWTYVATSDFDSEGKTSYSFTADQIGRQPYRLKCEVTSTDYSTSVSIQANTMLKADSPNIAKLIKNEDGSYNSVDALKITDYCGLSGYIKNSGVVTNVIADAGAAKDFPKSVPSSLKDMIKTNKGTLCDDSDTDFDGCMQVKYDDDAISSIYETSGMDKNYTLSNDPKTGRANLKYYIGALDGYYIEQSADKDYVESAGIPNPVKDEVVFYDLLPYGVVFDPSVPVTAGRLNAKTKFSKESDINKSQVSVTVDSSRDIIENCLDTGRTLVIFHLKYSGGDATVYENHKWCENWGLIFGAYYEWKDRKTVENGVNIAAFMPELGAYKSLLGDVSSNDGSYIQKGLKIDESNKVMIDYIMGARNKPEGSIRNVLYAQCRINEDIATSETMGVYKYVRSDDDRFGSFSKSAFVDCKKGYSYDITVKNTKDAMSNIVLFDRLEAESESQWRGKFAGILTTELEGQGVKPVIYYSTSSAAPLPTPSLDASAILTNSNGWYTAEQFRRQGYALSEVRSIAVDASKKADNSDFLLEANSAIGIRIKMKAPDNGTLNEKALNTAMYAAARNQDLAYIVSEPSDETVVTLGKPVDMVVEKHITEKTPEDKRGGEFSFSITDDNGYAYANKEYYLYEEVNGAWNKCPGLHATGSDGAFRIKANQRAVFKDVKEVNRLNVNETDNLFWECEVSDTRDSEPEGITETTDEEGNFVYRRSVDFTNTYHPLLFMSKKVKNVPDTVNVQDYTFKFQISVNGKTNFDKGLKYAYVCEERKDGVSPKVNEALGDNGYGETDENGYFTLRKGEIIAFNRMFEGDEYVIKEILPKDADFLCAKKSVKGTLKNIASTASIENNYRYRDLDFKKELTSQSPDECSQEFTFRVCVSDNSAHIASDGKRYNGSAVSGNAWVVLDENGEETAEGGTLSADGEFTCAAAGKTVRIKGLDSEVKYVVTETDSGENYRPYGNGSVSVTMPENGTKKATSMTNDYLIRDFKVTKRVYYNEEDASEATLALSKEFSMNARINGTPLANREYMVQENGVVLKDSSGNPLIKKTDADGNFTIKHGQTVVFKDAGRVGQSYKVTENPDADYPQSFPTDIYGNAIPSEGYLSNMENEAVIGNGFYGLDTSSKIIISKNITSGDTQASKDYLTLLKDVGADGFDARRLLAVSYMNVEITASNGNKYTLPGDLECTVLDEWKNVTETIPVSSLFADADGKVINVLPGQSISVTANQLKAALFGEDSPCAVTSVSVGEANTGYQHIVYTDNTDDDKKYTIALGQINPVEDGVLTKRILSEGVTLFEITNQLDVMEDAGSVIQKEMTFGSKGVPKGAILVWQVQRYTGGKWLPADGVKYFSDTRGGGSSVSKDTPLLTTGKDGKVILKKTDFGMPRLKFMEKVYLNRTTPTEGDLQVVELLEESDDSWGYLAGYGRKKSGKYEYDMSYSSENDDSVKYFINTNNFGYVKVQKETGEASDDVFSMIVKRVTKLEDNSGQVEVKETATASGIGYDVYDAKTKKLLRSAVTNSDGEFTIMSGQYANLKLPNDLYFTVQEDTAPNYNMIRLTASDKKVLTQLKENSSKGADDDNSDSILIKTTGEPVLGQDTELTHADYLNGITNAITGETLNMSKALDMGIFEIAIPEYFYRPGDATLYHLVGVEGGSQATPTCDFRTSYDPLKDSPGMPHIKSLILPDSVKGVDTYAFAFGEGLENVHLSEGLSYIGDSAFCTYGGDYSEKTNYVKMNLPNSLTYIGAHGLALESPLIEGDITLKEFPIINEYAFGENAVIDGSITIDNGCIMDYAFNNVIITKEVVLSDCDIGCASFNMDILEYKDKMYQYLDKTHLHMTITGANTMIGVMEWGERVIDKLSIGGDGLEYIGSFVPDDCSFSNTVILELELLEGVLSVGSRVFESLCADAYYDGKIDNIGLKKLIIPGTIEYFDSERSFANNRYLTDIVWKEGTEYIFGGNLFMGCYSLKTVKLPDSLQEMGSYMFKDCTKLNSVELPPDIKVITEGAFDGARSLKSIDLHEGITDIEAYAFRNTGLESISLPQSLQYISRFALRGTSINVEELKLPEGAVLGI